MNHTPYGHTSLKKSLLTGARMGAFAGIVLIVISIGIAYFFVEYNMNPFAYGMLRMVNYFHPLNPMLLKSIILTLASTTLTGALMGYAFKK